MNEQIAVQTNNLHVPLILHLAKLQILDNHTFFSTVRMRVVRCCRVKRDAIIVLKTKPVRWFDQKKPKPKPSPVF
jgi:hypothetical protein